MHLTHYITIMSILIAPFCQNRSLLCLLLMLLVGPPCSLLIRPDLPSQINWSMWHNRKYKLKLWIWPLGVTPAYWHVRKKCVSFWVYPKVYMAALSAQWEKHGWLATGSTKCRKKFFLRVHNISVVHTNLWPHNGTWAWC